MDDYIFKELKSVMDKYESIDNNLCMCEEITEEQEEFLRNSAIYFAKAIYNEIPESDKVAKMILVMYEK